MPPLEHAVQQYLLRFEANGLSPGAISFVLLLLSPSIFFYHIPLHRWLDMNHRNGQLHVKMCSQDWRMLGKNQGW